MKLLELNTLGAYFKVKQVLNNANYTPSPWMFCSILNACYYTVANTDEFFLHRSQNMRLVHELEPEFPLLVSGKYLTADCINACIKQDLLSKCPNGYYQISPVAMKIFEEAVSY